MINKIRPANLIVCKSSQIQAQHDVAAMSINVNMGFALVLNDQGFIRVDGLIGPEMFNPAPPV